MFEKEIIEMKKIEEMNRIEKEEFAVMLWSWLEGYTDEVINKVLPQVNDILNNETAMFMLKELHLRKKEEAETHISDLACHFDDGNFRRWTSLTHSSSYGDVLADMYIRPEWQRSKKTENNAE